MSLSRGVIHDNQVARRGFLGTTVNFEDETKNCSHIHHFHVDHNAPCCCITIVMQNLGGGRGGRGRVSKVHYCLCENGEWQFFFSSVT